MNSYLDGPESVLEPSSSSIQSYVGVKNYVHCFALTFQLRDCHTKPYNSIDQKILVCRLSQQNQDVISLRTLSIGSILQLEVKILITRLVVQISVFLG